MTATRSGVFSLAREEDTALAWPRAICDRSCSTRTGRLLEAEKFEVSKSRTCWYAPAWKAEWMFMSSAEGQQGIDGARRCDAPPSGEYGSIVKDKFQQGRRRCCTWTEMRAMSRSMLAVLKPRLWTLNASSALIGENGPIPGTTTNRSLSARCLHGECKKSTFMREDDHLDINFRLMTLSMLKAGES